MTLTKKDLENYKNIYQDKFGIDLGDSDFRKKAESLFLLKREMVFPNLSKGKK